MASENLTLGKGELWFNPFTPGTKVGTGFDFLGNCPELTLTVETEKLDHYGSTRGIRVKDASVVVEKIAQGSFVCDDIKPANLARFLGGTDSTLTATAETASTSTFASVVQGRRYQLGTTPANPTGARSVTSVSVEDTETTPATFVVNTDYIVHEELGMIEIVEGGGIADGTEIVVTFDTVASTRSLIVTGENEIEGELKFISFNHVGAQLDYWMPHVNLTPNGDFTLISEEWTTLPFSIEALKRGNLALVYGDGRPVTV